MTRLLPLFLAACLDKGYYDTGRVPEGQRCDFVAGLYHAPDDMVLSVSNPGQAESTFSGCAWDLAISGCTDVADFYAIVYPEHGWPEDAFTAVVSYHGKEPLTTTCSLTGRYDDGAGVTTVGELTTFDVTVVP